MKNMFFVINKEKIYAYIVSIMTIVVIFFMSNAINSDLKDTKATASNSIENSIGEAVSTSTPNEIEKSTESDENEVECNDRNEEKEENTNIKE